MSSLIFRLGDAFPRSTAFGAHGQVIDWGMGFGSFLRAYRISTKVTLAEWAYEMDDVTVQCPRTQGPLLKLPAVQVLDGGFPALLLHIRYGERWKQFHGTMIITLALHRSV